MWRRASVRTWDDDIDWMRGGDDGRRRPAAAKVGWNQQHTHTCRCRGLDERLGMQNAPQARFHIKYTTLYVCHSISNAGRDPRTAQVDDLRRDYPDRARLRLPTEMLACNSYSARDSTFGATHNRLNAILLY